MKPNHLLDNETSIYLCVDDEDKNEFIREYNSKNYMWKSINEPNNLNEITNIIIKNMRLKKLPDWMLKCNNLTTLDISNSGLYGNLTQLSTLPNSLRYLDCSGNRLVELPELPISLQTLICNGNNLNHSIKLPNSLRILKCQFNNFKWLPELPNLLEELYCDVCELTQLPEILPNSLELLSCAYNQLTQLPLSLIHLPKLRDIYYVANPIKHMPQVLSIFLNNLHNKIKYN